MNTRTTPEEFLRVLADHETLSDHELLAMIAAHFGEVILLLKEIADELKSEAKARWLDHE